MAVKNNGGSKVGRSTKSNTMGVPMYSKGPGGNKNTFDSRNIKNSNHTELGEPRGKRKAKTQTKSNSRGK